jgi:hypothetical protein
MFRFLALSIVASTLFLHAPTAHAQQSNEMADLRVACGPELDSLLGFTGPAGEQAIQPMLDVSPEQMRAQLAHFATKQLDVIDTFLACAYKRRLAVLEAQAVAAPTQQPEQTPLGLRDAPLAPTPSKSAERYWVAGDVVTPSLICENWYCNRPGIQFHFSANSTPIDYNSGSQVGDHAFGTGDPLAAGSLITMQITQQPADGTYICGPERASATVPATESAINGNSPVHLFTVTCQITQKGRDAAAAAKADKDASDALLQRQ